MFATLLGGLPRPLDPAGAPLVDDDAAVIAALEAQVASGLEPLTDGRLRIRGPFGALAGLAGVDERAGELRMTGLPRWRGQLTVDGWRFAATHAAALVKQALPGPFTLGRRFGAGDRDAMTMAFASALRAEIAALASAGCALVEIEERDAHLIGADEVERRTFVRAHRLLLDGIEGVHVSLAIVSASADAAGIETILAAPYRSLAVDLIDGPDNWRLVTAAPGDRGIVCGALSTRDPSDDGPELLLWAAGYAAASGSRGLDRVGLATAGSLAALPWTVAARKLERLGHAARLAALPASRAVEQLEPRAINIRSAAAGRPVPDGPRGRRRPPS